MKYSISNIAWDKAHDFEFLGGVTQLHGNGVTNLVAVGEGMNSKLYSGIYNNSIELFQSRIRDCSEQK